jgi:TrmH family RNA methyltransferase
MTVPLESASRLVILEGLHAVKHAHRFGATIVDLVTDQPERVLTLADQVAPDLRPLLESSARLVPTTSFNALTAQPVPTRLVGWARRPGWVLADALPTGHQATVLLDDPRNSKNVGAVIRVAAAAGAAGVLLNGASDGCDPMAVRGAAGLQWALPWWGSATLLGELDQAAPRLAMVGFDAAGGRFDPAGMPGPVILAFGSERSGLSDAVKDRCDHLVSLPMTPGVSSLNLATCVAAALYLRRYAIQRPDRGKSGFPTAVAT